MDSQVHQKPAVSYHRARIVPEPSTPPSPTTRMEYLLRQTYGIQEPAVLLSCGISFNKLHTVNDFTMARAFCRSWTCQPTKKRRTPTMAFCHVDGVIKKIYRDLVWRPSAIEEIEILGAELARVNEWAKKTPSILDDASVVRLLETVQNAALNVKQADEWSFTANEAPEYAALLGLDLSAELTQRGMANPVRYINCD